MREFKLFRGYGYLGEISLPIISRAVVRPIAQDLVPVQPLLNPTNQLDWMFHYERPSIGYDALVVPDDLIHDNEQVNLFVEGWQDAHHGHFINAYHTMHEGEIWNRGFWTRINLQLSHE